MNDTESELIRKTRNKKELYLCDKHKNTVLLGYVVLKLNN